MPDIDITVTTNSDGEITDVRERGYGGGGGCIADIVILLGLFLIVILAILYAFGWGIEILSNAFDGISIVNIIHHPNTWQIAACFAVLALFALAGRLSNWKE